MWPRHTETLENVQQHLMCFKVTHWHLSSSSLHLTTCFSIRFWKTLMVSLLLFVEVHVIPQFELVLSCMQMTSFRMTPSLCRKSTRGFQYMGDKSLSHQHFSGWIVFICITIRREKATKWIHYILGDHKA